MTLRTAPVALLGLLASCGGGETTRTTLTPDAPVPATPDAPVPATPDAPVTPLPDARPAVDAAPIGEQGDPLVTPVGAPTGDEVEATGSTVHEPKSGATLTLPGGPATVALQPVENVVPGAIGDGVAVTAGELAIISFPYAASADPAAIHLAVQNDDGSWQDLAPLRIDRAARTVSAALPPRPSAKPQATAAPRIVIQWLEIFYMWPGTARLRAGKSLTLTPYALAREIRIPPCEEVDCELPPLPTSRIIHVPFTNAKPGYLRVWYVNDVLEGDDTVGRVAPNAGIGAVYTAPARKPEPSTVEVEFISTDQSTGRDQPPIVARIEIEDCPAAWVGSADADNVVIGAGTLSMHAAVRWTRAGDGEGCAYTPAGTVDVIISIADTRCSVRVDSAEIDPGASSLTVDYSVDPPQYFGVGSADVAFTVICPMDSQSARVTLPWLSTFPQSVTGDGTVLAGSNGIATGGAWSWSFRAEN